MLYLADERSSAPAEIRPAQALLTPTWIFALVLLVANDHWLKGSGLLPGAMTGKLSDFVGMLVAPTLLAALLFVRTRGALLACHVAVALVFSGIQLSREFADLWSASMGVIGFPWTITCDPTDLLALPFLLLSWKLLVPQMNPELPALAPVQRTAVATLSVCGLWSTVATSREPFEPGTWYEDVYGHLYINNANDYEIALHIRPLRDDMLIDCAQIAEDPGRLLDQNAFGEAEHWLLPERTNVAIDLGGDQCGAVWVAGEGIEPRVVFTAELDTFAPTWWPGQSFDPHWLAGPGLAIEFDSQGRGEWLGYEELLFVPKTEQDEQGAECEPSAEELRIDWQLEVPNRAVSVLAAEAGVDGCFELELQELAESQSVEPFGAPYGFYLCAPAAAVPFAAGDVLNFAEYHHGDGGRELTVTSLNGETLQPLSGEGARTVRFMRGVSSPTRLHGFVAGTPAAFERLGCPWQIEANECATVDRPVDIGEFGESNVLQPGAATVFPNEALGVVRTSVLAYARQLAALDLACAEGSTELPFDIDIAVIDEPL